MNLIKHIDRSEGDRYPDNYIAFGNIRDKDRLKCGYYFIIRFKFFQLKRKYVNPLTYEECFDKCYPVWGLSVRNIPYRGKTKIYGFHWVAVNL